MRERYVIGISRGTRWQCLFCIVLFIINWNLNYDRTTSVISFSMFEADNKRDNVYQLRFIFIRESDRSITRDAIERIFQIISDKRSLIFIVLTKIRSLQIVLFFSFDFFFSTISKAVSYIGIFFSFLFLFSFQKMH